MAEYRSSPQRQGYLLGCEVVVEAQFGLRVQGEIVNMSGRSRWNWSKTGCGCRALRRGLSEGGFRRERMYQLGVPFLLPPTELPPVDCIALTHKVGRVYRSKKNVYLFAEASGRWLLLRALS